MIIQSLLDTDLYKLTMQQVVFHHFSEATVEYAFQNRSADIDLRPFAREIQDEIEQFCALTFTDDELAYLGAVRYLHPSYVDSLRRFKPDASQVKITTEGEFRLTINGNWYQTILFEVPVLAIINEVYFRHVHPATPSDDVEGMRRLAEKCDMVNKSGVHPFNLIEFGTRRRYSRAWQRRVLDVLKADVPQALVGSSNVGLAREFALKPFGTMAHEFLQACQAFAPLPDFQRFALDIWMQEYRGELGIALSDVVGMEAFLRDFDRLFCKTYDGARHDSGDPYFWGEKLIAHYKSLGIDPRTKSAVFSDALTMTKALALARHFQGRIQTSFGIGTHLTNDLGFGALQIVIKMTRCNGHPVAKVSDSPGKTVCRDAVYLDYLRHVFEIR